MLHWLSYDHQGGGLGGCIHVFDEYFLYVTEHVADVNMLHWLSCDYQGVGGGVLTSLTSTSLPLRNMLPLLTIEPMLLVLNKCMVHGNTSKHGDQCPCSTRKTSKCTKKRYTWACSWTWRHNVALLQSVAAALTKALWHWSVEKKEKMDEWMSAWYDWDDWKSKMSNVFFLALEEQNRSTTQAKCKFLHLSHTPANRNECPYCKHFLTSPANTSMLSLSLKHHNFKFITLTRAASQPVA